MHLSDGPIVARGGEGGEVMPWTSMHTVSTTKSLSKNSQCVTPELDLSVALACLFKVITSHCSPSPGAGIFPANATHSLKFLGSVLLNGRAIRACAKGFVWTADDHRTFFSA